MRNEQVKGNPPPRMSSRDGIPVEVIVVDCDDGNLRVPTDRTGCLGVDFRLKEDMAVY
jgi:hypothetical protein